jgi:hypothetical protein
MIWDAPACVLIPKGTMLTGEYPSGPDLDFSSLYLDPVKEALIELKHPGRTHPTPAPTVITGPVYKP